MHFLLNFIIIPSERRENRKTKWRKNKKKSSLLASLAYTKKPLILQLCIRRLWKSSIAEEQEFEIKGKTRICAAIFLINNLFFLGIGQGFKARAVGVDSVWGKILHVCLWSMIMSVLSLFGLVIQTIIYFICKSYHHENIDKSALADHLEMYGNDYIRLDTKELHMQHSMV